MIRIKTNMENDPEILWKKIGGGTFRMASGRIIKPNQTFRARLSQIPVGFRDVIIPQEPVPAGQLSSKNRGNIPEVVSQGKIPKYKLALRGNSKTWYDILDENGKVLNEKGMSKEAAEKLLHDLEQ